MSNIVGNNGDLLTVKSYHAQIDCTPGISEPHCDGGTSHISVLHPDPKDISVISRKIYSYVPNHAEGKCYVAYTVPMICVVTPQEIQVIDGHHAIHKRDTTHLQRFFGMVIPGYGVYLNQQQQKALSTALEDHINSTDRVVTAISIQLDEVTLI
ncbi:hypothetical protein N1851_010643 [Merluccius polli]|uniref:Uncharacterized protein n=1 Tax=Merluccius polli TaxID=89951 RepID=A0AA47MZI7_MERPO|nr:hypothetical protein N1851_010643 [Merluccius polli]